MKIAILGADGSFTEQAAQAFCLENHIKPKFVRAETHEDVFSYVDSKEASLGVIPVSNSIGGGVEETILAMSKHLFTPVAVLEINISQNLLVKPGIKAEEITRIASHPQALSQARLYLARNWLKAERLPYSSTAAAARDLATGKLSKETAVIASANAAKIHKLEILRENVQDSMMNFTQFLIFKAAE